MRPRFLDVLNPPTAVILTEMSTYIGNVLPIQRSALKHPSESLDSKACADERRTVFCNPSKSPQPSLSTLFYPALCDFVTVLRKSIAIPPSAPIRILQASYVATILTVRLSIDGGRLLFHQASPLQF